MTRALAAASLVVCASLVAGCGGSSLQAIAHKQAKYYGDPHAAITRIETVQIRGARPGHERWAMIQMKSRHAFRVGCISAGPGLAGDCHARYLEVGVDLTNREVGLYWGLTASEVSTIAGARHASPRFRIFPDTAGLYLRCAIPRCGPSRGTVTGTCSTNARPSDHVRRVEFIETWRNGGSVNLSKAVWVVTLSRDGRVQSIHVTGQPPQLVP